MVQNQSPESLISCRRRRYTCSNKTMVGSEGKKERAWGGTESRIGKEGSWKIREVRHCLGLGKKNGKAGW